MACKFQKIDVIDIEQDPVRPELSLAFRNSDPTGSIAIAYTVWSHTKGAGCSKKGATPKKKSARIF